MRAVRDVGWTISAVVGADRNLAEVTDRLLTETSVVMIGTPGSGKSYFARAVITELRSRRVEPIVVLAAAAPSATPFGALRSTTDSRLDVVWQDAPAASGTPLIVVVDDAQALDPESLDTLVRGLYAGSIRLLLTVGATDGRTGTAWNTAQAITRLWLDGDAARYDLQPLDLRTADSLISQFVGEELLDTATRITLFTRSCGSRRLLRELATDAASELLAGGEPLDPAREPAVGSRLSDAVAAVVTDLTDEERLALGVLGRLRGIEFVAASRTIEPRVIEGLLRRKAVHSDRLPVEALFANHVLARGAEQQLAPGELDRALDLVATRALARPELAASSAVDGLIAARWLSQHPGVPAIGEAGDATRCRILTAAAKTANADGRPDLALTYARLGQEWCPCPPLAIEASRALAALQRFDEAAAALAVLDAATMSARDVRRAVRWWGSLVTWLSGASGGSADDSAADAVDPVQDWLQRGRVTDPGALAELELQRAEAACLSMDWETATALTRRALEVEGVRTATRIRAAVIGGYVAVLRGRFDESAALLGQAARSNLDPVVGRPVSATTALAVLGFEAFAGTLSGRLQPRFGERLAAATLTAAERDDSVALALAGIVSGVAGLTAGDSETAMREIERAMQRFGRLEFGVWRPLIVYLVSTELARRGHVASARSLFQLADERLMSRHRLFRYARLATLAELHAAAGDMDAAEQSLRAAMSEFAGRPRPTGRTVLDARNFERVSRFAGRLRSPGLPDGTATSGHPGISDQRPEDASGDPAAPELTERELEIALLVARQLSNKEIAQRLFLSVRTVESHVYTARGKLGARSRRELGRMVGRPGKGGESDLSSSPRPATPGPPHWAGTVD